MAALVHSFAVFDCCLVRLHARPLDQLFALAGRVLPGDAGREDLHEFVRLRLRAEEEARDGPGLEAAGLGAVYERFPASNPWSLDPEALYASELELSLSGARPVPAVLERVRGHVRRGERVAYVTDSILPGASLRRLLESHGFAGEVYCAGDLGKRKITGSLYNHVLAAEALEPGQLSHTGSDPLGDARAPKRMGIRVSPFTQARFTTHEEHLLTLHRASAPEASRVMACARLARLRGEPSAALADTRAFAASVAAPALTAFAAWALAGAGERGAKRLYFLAREGELPCLLAQRLHRACGGPEPRYLMGSLAAWSGPLLAGLARKDLDWLAAGNEGAGAVQLLARLSLTPEELLRVSGRSMPALYSDKPLDDAGLDALWELLDAPAARELLTRRASEASGRLLRHLEQEGCLEEGVLAVADMGWTLSTQRALRAVLAGRGVEVEGWYFGLCSGRMGRMEAGAHHALFMERAARALPGSLEAVLFRNVPLMERAFSRASHGRVLGYSERAGRVEPSLGPPPAGMEHTREIRETCLAFADTLAGSGWSGETLPALEETARESLRRFLVEPENAMARAVDSLPGEDAPQRPLLRRLGPLDALRAWLFSLGLGVAPRRPPRWVEGSAALSAAWIRPYLRRPRLMALLRAHFP
ncbi:hypothetical protein NNJEOMEG_03623 [Fundidesulfovibrio magnetotacticus]|uniref:Hydrolase (HAD superfamily) n=1 Tax=Fundidesulfovibrio magnetotacticus TaxID=2730080 RepID=A0A6V8M5D1_9BACT|nr:hypothetical protein [Fundidesulfovibrio magnetotacticus]GFK95755.1 hypothetical protein NNJEOMEG_03623 [Fundidesulfovibrio magnetotacticus]